MSMPPDILSQILQGGLMNYGQPNALDRGLMGGSPSMQLGMQMLANSNTPGRFGSLLGKSMLGTQDMQQKNADSQLKLLQQGIGTQQAVQMFPYLQQAMQQAFGQPGGGQPQGAPPQGGGAASGGPQGGAPMGGAPQGGPQSMANLGAILGLMGRPGGGQLIDAAKFQAENDPANVTRLAAAKGEIAQDIALMRSAPSPDIAQAAYVKFLKDAGQLNIGSMNGNVTTVGGVTPAGLGINTMSPTQGVQTVGGVESAIPGAAGTRQALAGAEAQGKATGEVIPQQDYSGAGGFVPRSTITGGGGAGAPTGARGAANAPIKVPPAIKTGDPAMDRALADSSYKLPPLKPGQSAPKATIEARAELLKDSQSATEAAAQSLQYLKAAQSILKSKGATLGAYGGLMSEASRWLPFTGSVDATNYQEIAKYLGNSALAGARQIYGPRMTQSEVKLQLNELSPSVKMTPAAVSNLLDTNIRSAQYTVDSAKRAPVYLAKGNDPQTFAQWNQTHFPRETVVNNGGNFSTPPAAALQYLRAHPETAAQFKAKYGAIPSQ